MNSFEADPFELRDPTNPATDYIGQRIADIAAARRARNGVQLAELRGVKSEPIRWLWPGWLSRGKLHILAGAPGTGKTTLALSLAATLSQAGRWPDGTAAPAGNVMIWSGEDDIADTLAPRLRAAGADEGRVFIIQNMMQDGRPIAFDPAKHISALADAAAQIGDVSMLIVDPLVAALGSADSHRNAETRNALAPLVSLSQQLDAAIIGITHHSKSTQGRDPVERVTGSIAFGALARIVLTAAKVEDPQPGQARRMLVRSKSNIGPDGGGFGYDLALAETGGIETSRVLWAGEIHGSARELLGQADAPSDGPGRPDDARSDAKNWLIEMLDDGPVETRVLKAEASDAGLSWRTVERAKAELGIERDRKSVGNRGEGGWLWKLPNSQHRQPYTL
ncbi:MAG: hypothetical protein Tsb0016_07400 [Sphingomonadales bacterium]